jgi:hypothetical protein
MPKDGKCIWDGKERLTILKGICPKQFDTRKTDQKRDLSANRRER